MQRAFFVLLCSVGIASQGGLLPSGNSIVTDLALAEVYDADIAADRSWVECGSVEALKDRQRAVRARLLESIGGFPEAAPLNTRVTGRVERDGYSIEKILFESQPGFFVTAHLFLPDAAKFGGKRAAVVVPCGHSDNGKMSVSYQRAGLQAARAGMVAMVVDPIDQGERWQNRKSPEVFNWRGHNAVGRRAELVGWSVVRFRLWDCMRAIDVLSERQEVDRGRIGVMGHSGGGTMASWVMCMDDRVKCAAPSGYLSTIRSVCEARGPQDEEQNAFGQLAYGFNHLGHIVLRAPVPVLHVASHGDFFPILGVLETSRKAVDVYRRIGADGSYGLADTTGPHHWHESTRTASVDWMSQWLQGGAPMKRMHEYRILDYGFSYDNVDTAFGYNTKSFADVRTNRWEGNVVGPGGVLGLPRARSAYDIVAEEADRILAKRTNPMLHDVCRIAGIRKSDALSFTVERVGESDGVLHEILVLDDGTPIPLATKGDGKRVVYVSDAKNSAEDEPIVARLLARGMRVTIADIRGFGENSKGRCRFYGDDYGDEELARLYFLLGKNLVGKRAEDIIAVAKHVGEGGKVAIAAKGRAAIPAAHAGFVMGAALDSLEIVDAPQSWNYVLHDETAQIGYADIVFGAFRSYDWIDLARAVEQPNPPARSGTVPAPIGFHL